MIQIGRDEVIVCVVVSLLLFPPLTGIEELQKTQYTLLKNTPALQSEDSNNPVMKYYPRKYLEIGNSLLFYPEQLAVMVVATDPDGIDSVLMKYRFMRVSDWNQSLLTIFDDENDIYNGTLHFSTNSTSSSYYEPVTIQVQYLANDTYDYTTESPIMEFTHEFGLITADGGAPLYDTPDLWYLYNTTGHEVTWATQEEGTIHHFTLYTLYQDGFLLEQYQWEGELNINVDDLPLGDHVYGLTVACGARPTSDTVTVHVVDTLPSGVHTGSVGPITYSTFIDPGFNFGPKSHPVIFIFGLSLVAIIIGFLQYRKFHH